MRLARASILFLLLVVTDLAQDQRYVISTYAGGGPLPVQAPGVNLSVGSDRKGLAIDAAGNLYFTSLNCVFELGQDGIVTRVAGDGRSGYSGDGGPATSAHFSMGQIVGSPPYLGSLPPGLAADNAGNLYVADNGNSRIRRISPDGIVTTVAGNGTFGFSGDGGPAIYAQLSSILGLAVDTAGNLLLSDSNNHRIRMIAPDGTITTVAGNGVCGSSGDGGRAASAQLCDPTGIALDKAGNLFIAEVRSNRIRRISPDGMIATVTGIAVSEPTNVSVDRAGNLFVVSDLSNLGNLGEYVQVVRQFSTRGMMTVVAGDACAPGTPYSPPSASDSMTAATTCMGDGLSTAVDGAGNLLVAAPYNRRIYRVSPDGSIGTAAGNGEYDFSGDGGPATSARLGGPGSLAADGAGSVFFVDSYNGRIRKVSPDGIITTIAGNGTWGVAGNGGLATNAPLSPTGIALDTVGNLFISNNLGGLRKVSPDGIITAVAAGRGDEDLAVDLAGNLFVTDYVSIRKISPGGATIAVVSHVAALSLAVDLVGNLFFADGTRIRRLSPDGSIVTVAGNGTHGFSGDGGPAIDAQLDYAVGVAVDRAGNLFIADRDNNRIRKVSPDGMITTIAGNGASGYSGDGGTATEAAISRPFSVAVDGAGNVYFSDVHNNVIRVLRPNQPVERQSVSFAHAFRYQLVI